HRLARLALLRRLGHRGHRNGVDRKWSIPDCVPASRRRTIGSMAIVVGIDLGGTNVRVAAADRSGILAELRERTDAAGGERVLAQIVRLARAAAGGSAVASVALGTAGVVAPGSGDVALSNNIAGWQDLRPH